MSNNEEDEVLPLTPEIVSAYRAEDEKLKRALEKERQIDNQTYLTKKSLQAARPKDKEYTIYHRYIKGFGQRVRPSGDKSYYFYYRSSAGKSVKIKIGKPETMSFDRAAEIGLGYLTQVSEGYDPRYDRNQKRQLTLGRTYKEYDECHCALSLSPDWRKQSASIFHRFLDGPLGDKPLAEIDRKDLMRCIRNGRTPSVQNHIHRVISSMYSWSVDMGYLERNIIREMRLSKKIKSRERVLNDRELSSAWHASEVLRPPFKEVGRVLLLTGQRRSEVANMRWSEINIQDGLWRLPQSRSKSGYSHEVPLTETVLKILEDLPGNTGFVFASPTVDKRPISGFSKMMTQWRSVQGIEDWRLHDLRRSLASGMARIGIAPHVIEAVIGHRTGIVSGVAAVYNRHRYEQEKREALEQWDRHVSNILVKFPEIIPPPENEVVL